MYIQLQVKVVGDFDDITKTAITVEYAANGIKIKNTQFQRFTVCPRLLALKSLYTEFHLF